LARQVPDAEKRAQADFIIETHQGLDHALAQVKRVAAELRRLAAEKRK
jgi:dephospho-CoA kinase